MNYSNISPEMTLNEWFLVYKKAYMPLLAPLTQRSYRGIYKNHISQQLGDLQLKSIDNIKVNIWAASLLNVSSKTKSNIIGVLQAVLTSAAKSNLIYNNISIQTKKVPKPKIEALTADEAKRLISVCCSLRSQHDLITLLALYTGCRLGELLALEWSDISDELNVSKQIIRVNGEYIISYPKYNSVRSIPLPEDIQKILRDYRASCGHISGLIFRSQSDKYLHQSTYRKHFKRQLEAAELPPNIRVHDLRHTFATLMLQSGVDPTTLSKLIGHTSPAFTLKQYTHTNKTACVNAMRSYYETLLRLNHLECHQHSISF